MSKVDRNCKLLDVLGLWLSCLNALASWHWQGLQHNWTASTEQSMGCRGPEVHTTYITGALFHISCSLELWAGQPLVAETHLLAPFP